MERKIIFIDVDGTLTNREDVIPDSTVRACRAARLKGHEIYLCTGRSKVEIYSHILDVGFDGAISAAGGCIETAGKIVHNNPMSLELLTKIVDCLKGYKTDFILESNKRLFLCPKLFPKIEKSYFENLDPKRKGDAIHPFIELLKRFDQDVPLYRDDINKIVFMGNNKDVGKKIAADLGGVCNVISNTLPIFGYAGGEINAKGTNKGEAIKILVNYLGRDIKDTMAFGDGSNDTEMFANCAISVAMGNAKQNLKDMADFITDDVDSDGLYNAFKHFGLI
jgi:Cof subfamily protein (haloacid dehalogenase superfamily)